MDLSTAKLIPRSRLLATLAGFGISKEYGAKTIERLTAEKRIAPLHTPTGRELLSFQDAQAVMAVFTIADS